MLVPIYALSKLIEALFGHPARLTLELGLHLDLIFIDYGERSGQTVLRVGVEVLLVLGDNLSHLLFLHFPDVVLLSTVRVHFIAIRHVYSGL